MECEGPRESLTAEYSLLCATEREHNCVCNNADEMCAECWVNADWKELVESLLVTASAASTMVSLVLAIQHQSRKEVVPGV